MMFLKTCHVLFLFIIITEALYRSDEKEKKRESSCTHTFVDCVDSHIYPNSLSVALQGLAGCLVTGLIAVFPIGREIPFVIKHVTMP